MSRVHTIICSMQRERHMLLLQKIGPTIGIWNQYIMWMVYSQRPLLHLIEKVLTIIVAYYRLLPLTSWEQRYLINCWGTGGGYSGEASGRKKSSKWTPTFQSDILKHLNCDHNPTSLFSNRSKCHFLLSLSSRVTAWAQCDNKTQIKLNVCSMQRVDKYNN